MVERIRKIPYYVWALLLITTLTGDDGSTQPMLPQEARLRNLTYSAPMYCELKKVMVREVGVASDDEDGGSENGGPQKDKLRIQYEWDIEEEDEGATEVFIGKMPVMLKSQY